MLLALARCNFRFTQNFILHAEHTFYYNVINRNLCAHIIRTEFILPNYHIIIYDHLRPPHAIRKIHSVQWTVDVEFHKVKNKRL